MKERYIKCEKCGASRTKETEKCPKCAFDFRIRSPKTGKKIEK